MHVLHSPRLKRDYPRPDVSLSEEKAKKMLSVKTQPHPDARSSRASAAGPLRRLNMEDFRFRTRSPFHVVNAASVILTAAFTGVTD